MRQETWVTGPNLQKCRGSYTASPETTPHHQDSALYPSIAQLERAAGFRREDTSEQRLAKLEGVLVQGINNPSEAVPLLADLLSIPTGDRYPPLNLTPRKRKEKTLHAQLAQVEGLAAQQPVLMVWEDVHWSDPTTRESLDLLVDRVPALRALVIITFRPEFTPPWVGRPQVTLLTLSRLPPRQRAQIISDVVGGKALPKEIVDQIIERTDGIPLFIEELTKAVVESGVVSETGNEYESTGVEARLAIPTSLHSSLLARLDRLASVREVAQIAAVLGRHFSHELISAVMPLSKQNLDDALEQLVSAELVFRRGITPDAHYTFKHAMVQDAAYSTLLRGQRQKLHARVAAVLEVQFPDTAQSRPELLAHHYTKADHNERAVSYWYRAGQQANAVFALKEAIAHLTKGIALLATLPENITRTEREIEFQLALAVPLIATHGYGSEEVEVCARCAQELGNRLGNHKSKFAVGRLVWNSSVLRRPLPEAVDLAQELMRLARDDNDTARLALAHRALGFSLYLVGAHVDADTLLGQGAMLADSVPDEAFAAYGEHPGMVCRAYRGFVRCAMGFLDDGGLLAQAAVKHARTRNNPVSLAWALISAAFSTVSRGDMLATKHLCNEAIALSQEYRLPQWMAFARQSLGWAMCCEGDPQLGIEFQEEALRSLHNTGSLLHTTRFRLQLAESFLGLGRIDQARAQLNAAFAHLDGHGETYIAPELHRVSILLLSAEQAPDDLIESSMRVGLEIARNQGAHLLELRLATCVSRLWYEQGKREAAYDLLAPIYGWFTEGFDTPVLQDAKARLDELS